MTAEQIARAERLSARFTGRRAPRRKSAFSSELVRAIQEHLTTLGYEPGGIDGLQGPRTMDAVKTLQRDNGIEPDGIISQSLLALLRTAVEIAKSGAQHATAEDSTIGTGTGFAIDSSGGVLTNHHIVRKCGTIRAVKGGVKYDAFLVGADEASDLALLWVEGLRMDAA